MSATSEMSKAPSSLHGLDLSRYRQPQLVEAFSRLTSFTYAGSLLLKPAFKIMWRSLLYQDGQLRWQQLLTSLSANTPVTQPPNEAESDSAPAKTAKAPEGPKRTIAERLIHFILVGIPMAVLVGLAYGIVNFVQVIARDIGTVASTSTLLFNQAKADVTYYKEHPEARPTKQEAIDAWSAQIVGPYTRSILSSKLGICGQCSCIMGPVARAVQAIVHRAASISASRIEKYARKIQGFEVFKRKGEAASSSSSASSSGAAASPTASSAAPPSPSAPPASPQETDSLKSE